MNQQKLIKQFTKSKDENLVQIVKIILRRGLFQRRKTVYTYNRHNDVSYHKRGCRKIHRPHKAKKARQISHF